MEIFTVKKNRNLIIGILFAVLILCSALLCFSPLTANADSQVKVDLFLPQTALEYKELTSPIDVYSDESVTAIAQGGASHSLLLYYNGEYSLHDDFTSIKQIKKLDDENLLIIDDAKIFKFNFVTKVKSAIVDASENEGATGITGNYFDIFGNKLVKHFAEFCTIYTIDNGVFTYHATHRTVATECLIAINENFIFFSENGNISKVDINNPSSNNTVTFIKDANPVKIIANNQYLYYLSTNNKIFKVDMQGIKTELVCNELNRDYDLGNINNPTNISFRGENLLVIQSDTIQEYKIEDDQLDFTGFAIAKEKTAYNRVNGKATGAKIQKFNNTVAVLDDYKLTIIENNDNIYSKEKYKNYLLGQEYVLGQGLSSFALGKNSVLLKYGDDLLKLLDTSKTENNLTEIYIPQDLAIQDICYQGSFYYILATTNNSEKIIYKLDTTTCEVILIHSLTISNFTPDILNVDVYGNIYLAKETKIIKLDNAQNYQNVSYILDKTVDKLYTDLNGSLFALIEGKICYLDTTASTISIEELLVGKNIQDFSIDITSDICYFVTNDSEQIFTTKDLQNYSIEDIRIPNDFKTTNDSTNTASEDLQVYTVSADENVFIVTKNQDTLKYKAICDAEKEFIYACAITDNLHLLIGQDEIAISLSATNCPGIVKDTNCPESAYVSSSVNGYYYPIITLKSDYALTNADSQKVRLDKNTLIKPSFITTILDKDFYYATFVVDNVEYKGYVPIDYTVEVLEKDITSEQYTIETLTNTYLYSDAQLTNIKDNIVIENGTAVRVYEKQENYAKIAVNVDGQWIDGYVSTDCIIDSSTIAVRNILLIILVVTCLGTTSIYFLLKRKRVSK